MKRLVMVFLLSVLVVGCQDRRTATAPDATALPGGLLAAISDGAHDGGNPDFFFLPPLAANPVSNRNFDRGKFNPGLRPVVRVYRLADGCTSTATPSPTSVYGPVVAPVNAGEEQYQVEWNTRASNLTLGAAYRICVFSSSGGTLLGSLDVQPVTGGPRSALTGDTYAFQDDRTLPIKFRIERGALCFPSADCTESPPVTSTGGDFTLPPDQQGLIQAAVSVPPGAVASGDVVTIVIEKQAPPYLEGEAAECLPTGLVQSKGCYHFSTDPPLYRFHTDVRMEACVDVQDLGPGQADALRLHKFNTEQGLQRLTWVDPTLIECGPPTVGDAGAHGPANLAEAVWRGAGRLFADLVGPSELFAAIMAETTPKGLGGLGGSFSDVGGAVPSSAAQDPVLLSVPASATVGQAGLTASASGGSGTGAYSYASSTAAVCTVSAGNGSLTLLTAGTCSLTATKAADEIYKAATSAVGSFPVAAAAVATITVTPAGAAISGVGSTQTFTAVAKDAQGDPIGGKTFTWASLNPSVATVSSTGVATAVASGQVTISATADGITGYALLTVAIPGATPVNLWAPIESGTTSPLYGMCLGGLWGTSRANIFAVGSRGGQDGGTIVRYDGTMWSATPIGGRGLWGVWGTSGTDVFAVGPASSRILHYDGTAWSAQTIPTLEWLYDVWGTSGTDVFAVGVEGAGGQGSILHYNGTAWSAQASGVAVLTSVWGTSRSNVFAVGWAGTILRYDGTAWTEMTSGTTLPLNGVWGTSDHDVFAVGPLGTVLHYDGASWSAQTSNTSEHLGGVWGTSGTDVFAVGSNGTILHYNGTAWSAMASGGTSGLGIVWGAGNSEVYVAGSDGSDCVVLRGNRGATVTVTLADATLRSLGATRQLTATAKDASNTDITGATFTWTSSDPTKVSVSATGVVTAVGIGPATITATAPGGALGSTTVTVSLVAAAVRVAPAGASIVGVGATQQFQAAVRDSLGTESGYFPIAWTSLNPNVASVDRYGLVTAVGAGQATIAVTSGAATGYALVTVSTPGLAPVNLWAPMASGTTSDLYGVWGTSRANIFAVSYEGTVVHYNGTTWSAMPYSNTTWLWEVGGTSGSDVFATGVGGRILHYDGTTWSPQASHTSENLYGVWGTSGTDIVAVGTRGTILHYDGTAWSAQTSGTTEHLTSVWGTSRANVFAVGFNGTILRYDGTAWAAMTSGTTSVLYGVWGTSDADVFAVGYNGTVLHYDGASWSVMASEATCCGLLYDVWGTSGTDVFAVGYGGKVFHYDGTAWSAMASGATSTTALKAVWGAGNSDVYVVGSDGLILRGVRRASVAVTPATPTLTLLGATQQLTAEARDASGNVVSGVTFTWASSAPSIATVSSTGFVTAVASGTATITATAPGGASGSTTVNVSPALPAVTIDGVLGEPGWTTATTFSFDANLPGGGTTPATLHVWNDATNLYLAVRIQSTGNVMGLSFEFDSDDDGSHEAGDDVVGLNSTGPLYDDFIGTCPGSECYGHSDISAGGTDDGAGVFQSAGSFSVFEMSHPLNSGDVGHDFSLVPSGQTVGMILSFRMIRQPGNWPVDYGDTDFPGLGQYQHITITAPPIP